MLSVCLLFILVFCVSASFATQFDVHNANDFVTLVNKAANGDFNYDIVLWIDLDFTNDTLRGVVDSLPLGMKSNTDCTPYSGTFDGKGHIVKNLEMTDKEYSGLICDSRDAVIKNLVIDKTCSFSGNIVGGVTVNVSGSISVSKVEIYGRMNGRNVSGGIMGIVSDVNGGSIVVDDCGFHGTVVHEESSEDSSFYDGGFIGRITSCVDTNLLFSNNENDGTFNCTFDAHGNSSISSNIGGYVGGLTENLYTKLEIRDNVNKASFKVSSKGSSNVGGYLGYVHGVNATLVVKNNKNDGSMLLTTDYSVVYSGGYFGLFNDQGTSDIVFESNTNDGTIQVGSTQNSNSFAVGGFCGYFYIKKERVFDFINNTNDANIIAEANNTGTDTFGGFVGTFYPCFSATDKPEVRFINNTNNGNIGITGTSSLYISGFVGYIYPYGTGSVYFYNNINNGDMNTESFGSYSCYIGGFVGTMSSSYVVTEDHLQLHFLNNTNSGGIKARGTLGVSSFYTGGFAGYVYSYRIRELLFKNNINYGIIDIGSIKISSFAGGFVGQFYLSYATDDQKNHIINNTNNANIDLHDCSYVSVGSIVGYFYQSDSIEFKLCNNTNTGNFTIQSNLPDYMGNGYIGGLMGYFDFTGQRQNHQLVANNVNNGTILVLQNTCSCYRVGGIAGFVDPDSMGELHFCDNINNGNVTVTVDTHVYNNCFIGGVVGVIDMSSSVQSFFYRNTNNGRVLVDVNASSSKWHIGGFVGEFSFSCDKESGFYNNTNNCDIHVNLLCSDVGGLSGFGTISNYEVFYTSNNINKGNISVTGNVRSSSCSESRIGGIAGYFYSGGYHKGLFNGNINKGNINVLFDQSTSNYEYIGGLVGYYSYSASNVFLAHDNINSGRIHATGSYCPCLGGLFGQATIYASANSSFYNNINEGTIHTEDSKCPSCIGGIAGSFSCSSQVSNTTNDGDIEFIGISPVTIGGFSGSLIGYDKLDLSAVTNNGNIKIKVNSSANNCIGGIVGSFSSTNLKDYRFEGNRNNGNVDVEATNVFELYTGGLIGQMSLSDIENCSLCGNTNNGFWKTNGTIISAFYGGLVGSVLLKRYDTGFFTCFKAKENNNNGKSSFNLMTNSSTLSRDKYVYGMGGLLGRFVSDSIFSAEVESNTNDGSIEGMVETGSIYAGGIVGGMPSAANVSVVGNTNKAMIKITCPEVDEFQSFVGGIMGMYSNSSLMKMNLRDNANYGDIISECIRHEVGTCGLVCSTDNEGESEMTIENCVNHGDVEGSVAYGICDVVKKAKNVVNIGEVSGTRETYSIWKELRDSATTVYCGSATCTNCNKNVKSIILDKNDGRYHVVEDNKVIVDEALNEEVDKEGYEKRWDKELKLRRYVNVYIGSPVDRKVIVYVGTSMEESGVPEDITKYHLIPEGKSAKTDNEVKKTTIIEEELHLVPYYLVTISGAVNEKIYIRADKKQNLGDISKKLKEYFESKEYAIGNIDTNELYEGERSVNGDLNIAVMRRNTVVIEMEGESVLAVDVNANEIAEEISVLTGIDTENILVNIISDDNGYILRVIVVLKDADMSDNVAAAINSLVKDDKCNAGILCHSRDARVVLPGQDIDAGTRGIVQTIFLLLHLSVIFVIVY